MKTKIFIALAIGCSFAFASCGQSRYVVSERPNAPYYRRPLAPGPNYMWLDGDWMWRTNHYVYRQGYWAAPRYNRRWEAGRWQQNNRGWQWQRGNWRH